MSCPVEAGRSAAAGYRTQSIDTRPEAEWVLIEAYRRMPPWEKTRRLTGIIRACEQLALAGIRERYPQANEQEVCLRLAALRLDHGPGGKYSGGIPPGKGAEMIADPIRVTIHVAEILEGLGIPYLVGGSMASSIFGEPRSTDDVDIVADLRLEHVQPFVSAMEGEFYLDEVAIREAVQNRTSFNVIHLEMVQKVDIFVLNDHPLSQEEMRRRRPVVVVQDPVQSLYLATAEDIILQKLEWYRLGGGVSDRQWRDVLGVLKVQAERLDPAYLHHWADALGLADILERALREAGFSEGVP